jgi:sensor histidine kinase YesM
MALQPLVENAIRHGIGRSSSARLVEIRAARTAGSLEIRVRDDGPGLTAEAGRRHGIGLANTRERLLELYGAAARLVLENAEGGGAVATMVLPYHAVSRGEEEVHADFSPAG